MVDITAQRNIAGMITPITSIFPVSSAAATINGASIDRLKHNLPMSLDLHTAVGAASGSPSAISVVSTLQHSQDNSTWTSFQPDGANNATGPTLMAISTESDLAVDLTLAARYVRIQTVVSFTGGSSPAIEVMGLCILGGEPVLASI